MDASAADFYEMKRDQYKKRIKELERLLMTTTPIEERREAALKTVKRYTQAYKELEQEVAKLRAALGKYGQHAILCPKSPHYPYSPKSENKKLHLRPQSECTCGLEQALEGDSNGSY